MAKKRKKRNKNDGATSGVEATIVDLGLSAADWDVKVHYSKGMLSGGRGVVVEVVHIPSGRRARESRPGGTKNQCHQLATEMIRELVQKLRSS